MDFDDLLVKTVQLLQTQPDVLENYQERFRYIMVDEYQDTNTAQFKLVSLLAAIVVAMIVYFIACLLLRVKELGHVVVAIAERFHRRRPA